MTEFLTHNKSITLSTFLKQKDSAKNGHLRNLQRWAYLAKSQTKPQTFIVRICEYLFLCTARQKDMK